MKCPGCGHESVDLLETCDRCGAPMLATAVAPGASPADPVDDVRDLRFEPERATYGQWVPGYRRGRTIPGSRVDCDGDFVEMLDDDAPAFRLADEIFVGPDPGAPEARSAAPDSADRATFSREDDEDLPEPAWAYSGAEPRGQAGGESIIDCYDEVPEHYWAPEVAGLGRRALALLVDQSFLMAVLGLFFLGAYMALRLNSRETSILLAAAGLQASALPFALLAAVLSLAYFSFFHGSTGCTPGKALVGIEVRTKDGGDITWGLAILRWLAAALGLACAGVGIFWAIFEPRRRGWADLLSGTVVARPRREPAVDGRPRRQ